MARIHARRRGRSGSSPQTREKNPSWALKPKDVESKVVELSAEGNTTSQIGIALRDTYGVPSVKLATGKSISKILEIPLFFDSPQVRNVLKDIEESRDSILYVANLIGDVEEEE